MTVLDYTESMSALVCILKDSDLSDLSTKVLEKKTKQKKEPLTLYCPDFRCRFVNKVCTSIKEPPTVGSLCICTCHRKNPEVQ